MLRSIWLLTILALCSACSDSKTLCYSVNACSIDIGKEICGQIEKCEIFEAYGIFDGDKRDSRVHYDVVVGNIVWSVLGFESVVIPFFLVGWYLYEPISWVSLLASLLRV